VQYIQDYQTRENKYYLFTGLSLLCAPHKQPPARQSALLAGVHHENVLCAMAKLRIKKTASRVFWVLAENGFHGRMCLKGRNLRDFCESGKIGEKLAKLPTP